MKIRFGGFTFIELMVTLAIMATLALVAMPTAELTTKRVKERELRSALGDIRSALDAYKRATEQGRIPVKVGESGYPKSLEDLVKGVPDQKSPDRHKIFFLRRLPRDPVNQDASLSAEDTWGKRSYVSPPDDPKEGEDIFDVFSLSEAKGLNGIPYKQW